MLLGSLVKWYYISVWLALFLGKQIPCNVCTKYLSLCLHVMLVCNSNYFQYTFAAVLLRVVNGSSLKRSLRVQFNLVHKLRHLIALANPVLNIISLSRLYHLLLIPIFQPLSMQLYSTFGKIESICGWIWIDIQVKLFDLIIKLLELTNPSQLHKSMFKFQLGVMFIFSVQICLDQDCL